MLRRKKRNAADPGRTLATSLGLLLGAASLQAEAVILTLKNGDRISGELISENADRVTVRSPFAGKLRISKTEIAQREQPTPLATATPPAVAAAKVAPMPVSKPVASAPAAAPPATNAALGGLARLAPGWTRPFLTNWHGNVQLGMDLGFGTSDRQTFYGNANAAHGWNRVRNLADYHVAYGSVNAVQSANRMDGALKTDVDLGEKRRLYAYNQGGAGYDVVRRVSLEYNEGVGMGYKLLQRPKLILNGEFGAQYQHQAYQNAPDRSFVSLRIGENLTWTLFEKLALTQRLAYTPDIADFGVFRVRFDLGLGYPLFKRVTLNLNVIDQYDSQPPRGVENNDLQVQSTLGVTF